MPEPEGPGGPPATAGQHALDELRRSIVEGDLRPGQRVGQEEIARRLGVSLAPVREALAVLEQEGQLVYRPRRGYFVAELRIGDMQEIYELRRLLEARAARQALPLLDVDALRRIELAARDCVKAASAGDIAAELEANRRFHFGFLDSPDQIHTLRIIKTLWDSTEPYRAMYYNSPTSRAESLQAHDEILHAIREKDAEQLVAALDAHREHALGQLLAVLAQ